MGAVKGATRLTLNMEAMAGGALHAKLYASRGRDRDIPWSACASAPLWMSAERMGADAIRDRSRLEESPQYDLARRTGSRKPGNQETRNPGIQESRKRQPPFSGFLDSSEIASSIVLVPGAYGTVGPAQRENSEVLPAASVAVAVTKWSGGKSGGSWKRKVVPPEGPVVTSLKPR